MADALFVTVSGVCPSEHNITASKPALSPRLHVSVSKENPKVNDNGNTMAEMKQGSTRQTFAIDIHSLQWIIA